MASSTPRSNGIVLDAANVTVRGNRVVVARQWLKPGGNSKGIVTVNFAPVRLEGNFVSGWGVGIESRGAAIVTKNQVLGNYWGVVSYGGTVTGNVASFNAYGFGLLGPTIATSNSAVQNGANGFYVELPFAGSVSKNNIFGTRNSIYGVACGLHNVNVSELKATNNFRGESAGPGSVGADIACTNPAAPSTYIVPYAKKPFTVTILKP